jgi:hypothetical protein
MLELNLRYGSSCFGHTGGKMWFRHCGCLFSHSVTTFYTPVPKTWHVVTGISLQVLWYLRWVSGSTSLRHLALLYLLCLTGSDMLCNCRISYHISSRRDSREFRLGFVSPKTP